MNRCTAEVLFEIRQRCEASPRREACGFVVRRQGSQAVIEIENVADEAHAKDPRAFPRGAKESYLMEPGELLHFFSRLYREDSEVLAVWHSHVDAPALFSKKDLADALVDGKPALRGAEYIVVSLREGRAVEMKRYAFDGVTFRETSA